MTRQLTVCILAALLMGAAFSSEQVQTLSPAQAALESARQNNKYVFIMFWKDNDPATQAVRQTLNSALAAQSDKASSVLVRTKDSAEKPIIDQYSVSRSPMPLVLAIAPNGAVTGGFSLKLTEQDVTGAIVSSGHAACIKANQASKLVFLCVQPAGGTSELPAGVTEFKADPQYNQSTEIVVVRADDPAEATFLKALAVNPRTTVVVSTLLAPPRQLVATFEGAFTKEQAIEKLKAAQSGACADGKCGPGGCKPAAVK